MYRAIGYIVFILGLIIVFMGILVLVIDPPRTISYHYTVRIPYTIFEELPPGYHNYSKTLSADSAVLWLNKPGENTTMITVKRISGENCTYTRLVLHVYGEGLLGPVDNKYVNVSIHYILANTSREILLDSISIPIRASEITTVTPTIITMKPGETIYTTTPYQAKPTSYEVWSINNYLLGRVVKIDMNNIKVSIIGRGEGIELPSNTTKVIIRAKTDTDGRIHIDVNTALFCIKTYYIDKPTYIPRTYFYTYSIPTTNTRLGSLSTALILSIIGFTLMLVSLIPIIYCGNRDRTNPTGEFRGYPKKNWELEASRNMREVIEELEKTHVETPKGFSKASIREDRDGN